MLVYIDYHANFSFFDVEHLEMAGIFVAVKALKSSLPINKEI
jgi:hypothetical protein